MPTHLTVLTGAVTAALVVSGGAAMAAVSAGTSDAVDIAVRPVTKSEARILTASALNDTHETLVGPATEADARTAARKAGPSLRVQLAAATSDALAAIYTPAYAKSYAKKYMKQQYGWGEGEYRALVSLWQRESGWDYTATNASTGAYGIPQSLPAAKMSSEGDDWRTNPEPQIRWGLKYIKSTYGSPSATVSFWDSNGWY